MELPIQEEEDIIEIQIKKFANVIMPEKIQNGDWIDLRAARDVCLKKGEFAMIPLGVGMKLPEGYEAHVVPRSSTFKKYGIIQTNSFGVIDNSYSGDNDQWMMPVFALRETYIHTNDRICQFRIVESMPQVNLVEVEHLDSVDRNGFGEGTKYLDEVKE